MFREVVLDKTRFFIEWVFNDGKIYVRKALNGSGYGKFKSDMEARSKLINGLEKWG